jgi:LmbE family N-acetylglucosaminyl deacetylase
MAGVDTQTAASGASSDGEAFLAMLAAGTVVLVAPHLDDAVLSCGGTMHRLVRAGTRVIVVTIFTADPVPGGTLSTLARNHHRSWEIGQAPFGQRIAEDEEAAGMLGVESIHLGLHDALYRADATGKAFYQHDIVGVPVDPADAQTTLPQIGDALAGALTKLPDPRLVAPLGIGGHVDHLLGRQAAESLGGAPLLGYYEEFPYAWRRGIAAPESPEGLRPAIVSLGTDDVSARIAATRCYASQLAGLFATRPDIVRRGLADRMPWLAPVLGRPSPAVASARMATAVQHWTTRIGGERYWLR